MASRVEAAHTQVKRLLKNRNGDLCHLYGTIKVQHERQIEGAIRTTKSPIEGVPLKLRDKFFISSYLWADKHYPLALLSQGLPTRCSDLWAYI